MSNPTEVEKAMVAQIDATRASLGVTKKHLIEGVGMSRSTYDSTLAGGRSFTVRQVLKIAEVLRVDPTDLMAVDPS